MGQPFSRILPEDDLDIQTVPPLYVGTMAFITDEDAQAQLGDLRIRCVVSVMPEPPPDLAEVLDQQGIGMGDRRIVALEDSSDLYVSMFEGEGILPALSFIHSKRKEGKGVLVHCDAGLCRSPAVVVAYIMRYGTNLWSPQPMGYNAARRLVRQKRDGAEVGLFESDLRALERQIEEEQQQLAAKLASAAASAQSPRQYASTSADPTTRERRNRGIPRLQTLRPTALLTA